jgi:hypothetical protein
MKKRMRAGKTDFILFNLKIYGICVHSTRLLKKLIVRYAMHSFVFESKSNKHENY